MKIYLLKSKHYLKKTFYILLLFVMPFFLSSCGNIHQACAKGMINEIEFFLKKGGNVDLRNKNNQTLLHIACHKQHYNIVKLLVQNGADVNAVDKYIGTSLHYASRNGNTKIMKYLIAHGANINKSTKRNGSPLYMAARYNKLDVAKVLIFSGADTNLKSVQFTPLHMAALNGSSDVLSLLIKHHARINAVDANGNTPLHKTTNFNSILCAQILIRNGADRTKKNNKGKTAWDLAKENKCKPTLIKLLVPKGKKIRKSLGTG